MRFDDRSISILICHKIDSFDIISAALIYDAYNLNVVRRHPVSFWSHYSEPRDFRTLIFLLVSVFITGF